MKKWGVIVLVFLLFLVPVLAHEAGFPHEEPSDEEVRACSFPVGDEAGKTFGEWLITEFRPGYEATTASWWLAGILAVLVVGLGWHRWSKLPKKKRKPLFWLKIAGWVVAVFVLVYVAYSTYYYWYSNVSVNGLEICDEKGCRLSVHWHATLEEMSVCGEVVERPWETGDLSKAHTHKDNKIHLHTMLEIDPVTKKIINPYHTTLGGFFDEIGWKFSNNCFKDACDECNGKPAKTKVWKNGKLINENVREVQWRDGDKFVIKFE